MKYYITGIAILAADQIVKLIVRTSMDAGQSIEVLGDFFRITFIKNSGAAFSMMSGQRFLLLFIPIIAILIGCIYLSRHKDMDAMLKLSIVFIMAGGAGNVIDRGIFRWVTDMFDFSIFPPVFNIADIAVVLGCILMIVYVLFGDKFERNESKRK